MKTLITVEQGIAEIVKIDTSFLESLRLAGIVISDETICSVDSQMIQVAIIESGEILSSSIIEIYAEVQDNNFGLLSRPNRINYGSSGSFSPDNKGAYWRTLHAASFLQNWKPLCEIVNEHCSMYRDLMKEIELACK